MFLMQGSVELHYSPMPTITALLHFNELRAHAFLGKSASDEKIHGWYLDIDATHHMTEQLEYFSVKFGDTS